jgi:hypothetical protein
MIRSPTSSLGSTTKRGGKRQRPKRRAASEEKKHTLHVLLEQTKADLERSRTGLTLTRPESPQPEEKILQVLGDEYFLLLFYEHVSYQPRQFVDLSGWGPDLTPEVMLLVERLFAF